MRDDRARTAALRLRMTHLLSRTFDTKGLRRFITTVPGGDLVEAELPGDHAGTLEVVQAVVETGLRHGLFDEAFFARLTRERPRWGAEIAAIRADVIAADSTPSHDPDQWLEVRLRFGKLMIVISLGLAGLTLYNLMILFDSPPSRPPLPGLAVVVPATWPLTSRPPVAPPEPQASPPMMPHRRHVAADIALLSCPPPAAQAASPKMPRRRLERTYRIGQCVVRSRLLGFTPEDIEVLDRLLRSKRWHASFLPSNISRPRLLTRIRSRVLRAFPAATLRERSPAPTSGGCDLRLVIKQLEPSLRGPAH